MQVPYAPRVMAVCWVAAGWAGIAYGVYLTVVAVHSPPGTELTGHWILQPPFKALMALLLTVAAFAHPIVSERRWLMPALLLSATGDWLLAIPWWTMSFVLGLAAFLCAHLCFIGALAPLVVKGTLSRARIAVMVALGVAAIALLVWFWPHLGRDDLTLPVTVYIFVLTAMACTAIAARLPTIWVPVGAVCFMASDAMIAISRFILGHEALAVPIWWLYAAAMVLITAGFFFGRDVAGPDDEPGPAQG
ncbi:lysoplasmalogenase [Mycobacterium montefiorense]|uniref:lysoplasmalogenase n=1 Tax=Mycobacterium montefiorense TaxID=154654 RepID=UPI0021F3BEF7|nr:lysoplasmalogenase [Mycobacterium montefiorense]